MKIYRRQDEVRIEVEASFVEGAWELGRNDWPIRETRGPRELTGLQAPYAAPAGSEECEFVEFRWSPGRRDRQWIVVWRESGGTCIADLSESATWIARLLSAEQTRVLDDLQSEATTWWDSVEWVPVADLIPELAGNKQDEDGDTMSTNNLNETVTLFRPVGLKEYELIREADMKAYPPRLEFQPIFYPVLNEEYAAQIARDWNTKDEASDYVGIVTRFEVDADYASQFDRKVVGSSTHEELWVPAEELEEFNAHIAGDIEVIDVFYGDKYDGPEIG